MRVLHVINSLERGGAEHLLVQLLPALSEHGVAADLLVLSRTADDYCRVLAERGIRIFESGVRALHSPLQAAAVASRMSGYDVVHAHLFPTLLWTALAKALRRAPPVVYTEHSTSNRRRAMGLMRPVDAFSYGRLAKIICISQGVRDSLVGYLRWLQDRVAVIHNGIGLHRYQSSMPLPDTELPASAPLRLLCVANLIRAKGHKSLLKAMRRLPPEVHLLLAGSGPLEASLRQLIRALDLERRVHFLGFRPDVDRLYKSCAALVLPSVWEGFSLVAVEAMASGLPVVASRVPGLQEVVGDAAELFKPSDPEELARCIRRVLSSAELRSALRERGIRRSELFSIDRTAEQHASLYKLLA
jgi:glycosyltransferase involved in cell wall biosynthesis